MTTLPEHIRALREALEAGPFTTPGITIAEKVPLRAVLDALEAAQMDAERYRWLRDVDDDPVGLRSMWGGVGATAADIDNAIDAAKHRSMT